MTPQRQLARDRYAMAMGFFESVIQRSNKILEESVIVPPADIALYSLGETYAHHAFEGKNYGFSKYYFEKLSENFPDSPLTWEAKTYLTLYENFKIETTVPEETPDADHEPKRISRGLPDNMRFNDALEQNERILEQSDSNPPADAALYNLGLIYAHIDNPGKDFLKAREYFEKLIRTFPASPLAEEARIWRGLFQVIDKMQQIDRDIEQQKKQLNR